MSENGILVKAGRLYERFAHMLDYLRDPVLLLVRLYWGYGFFMAGKGKLMNLDKPAAYFASLNIPMPKFNAFMAGSTECFGGLLLLLGLGSRLVSIPLTIVMCVAYITAFHKEVMEIFAKPEGVLTADPFLFLMAAVLVMICGPGFFSLDTIIEKIYKKSLPAEEIQAKKAKV